MTDTMIDLLRVIAESDDADFLREPIRDAALPCAFRKTQRNDHWPRQRDTREHARPGHAQAARGQAVHSSSWP